MALNLPTFYKRLGSSIVFVAIMLTGLLWNEMVFLVLICLINVLCLRDYFRLMHTIYPETTWPDWLTTTMQVIALLLIVPVFFIHYISWNVIGLAAMAWVILPVTPTLLILGGVLSKKNALLAVLQSIGGIFYITLPVILLLLLRIDSIILPIALILMIWCNDTMAYLMGSFFGKTPFSSISPKKTWEGTVGGAVLTIVCAGLVGHYSQTYRMTDWIMLALCATIAGTLGDLLESKLKRMADVKDSGTLMPGHGGALDRFDSLLVAAPFAYVYVVYFMK